MQSPAPFPTYLAETARVWHFVVVVVVVVVVNRIRVFHDLRNIPFRGMVTRCTREQNTRLRRG
jgi:Na+/serine symporter